MKVALESLCSLLTDGTHYTPRNVGQGYPFLTVADMQATGLNFSTCSRISVADFAEADRQNSSPKRGDVLFSKDGTVGKVHVVQGEEPFAVLSSIAIIRPEPEKLHSGYLAHFLRSPEAASAADRSKTGSALRRIILKDIKRLTIDPPPLAEQARIAAILDQADAVRSKRIAALSRLNDLGQSIFYSRFAQSREVERKRIGDFAEVKGGKRLPKGAAYSAHSTEHPYIRVSNLNDGHIDILGIKYISEEIHKGIARYIVNSGDVIISIAGTIGVVAAVPDSLEGANLTENAAKITPKDGAAFDPEYIVWALQTHEARQAIRASTGQVTIGKLALFRIKDLKIPFPEIELQREFSAEIKNLDLLRKHYSDRVCKSEDLFASLQHRAFRGVL